MMRARRGSALILVLLMTLAIAGLSIAAIFMSSSAGLLSTFYDREREFRFAAEAGLESVRASMNSNPAFVVPDTGMRQVLAGVQIADASGTPLTKVRVNVYAAVTGDTSATVLPSVTLIAAAYDAGGTRYVARVDLRRESFSRYGLLVDSFPSGITHGPATVTGRVHSNGAWRMSGSGNRYLDTVATVGAFSGTGTFDIDSVVGVEPIAYPRDSTFLRLDSLAAAANLSFAPVTGGTRGSRLEFVAYDVDGDGTVEAQEGFARVFDATAGGYGDTTRLRASPTIFTSGSNTFHFWTDPIVQNQCGAFYLRAGRWHFIPVSVHRRQWARTLLRSGSSSAYTFVSESEMRRIEDYDVNAVIEIMDLPTARCFSAGSPFLMPAERLTNASGVVTGTSTDTYFWGSRTPPSGWPSGAPYGGSDTTFTVLSRKCNATTDGPTTSCTFIDSIGRWRAFAGTPLASAPDTVVQGAELPYLWPLGAAYNPASRGVISSTAGPLYVSGRVAGDVTLRVGGRVVVVDRLRYVRDPNDPAAAPCTDALGLLATRDILVVSGLTSRVRRIYDGSGSSFSGMLGGEPRFTMHGNFMSLTGTVGVESPTTMMGLNPDQLPCPDGNSPPADDSNGGCLAVSGGMVMRTYSPLHNGANTRTGFRYHGTSDRCQTTANRPPFFPLTNRYTFLRTLALLPADANTPAKIRTMLMRLKGKAL